MSWSLHYVASERADVTSSSYNRGRLKEGANINRSLVALGNVIQALGKFCCCVWSYTTVFMRVNCLLHIHSNIGYKISSWECQMSYTASLVRGVLL